MAACLEELSTGTNSHFQAEVQVHATHYLEAAAASKAAVAAALEDLRGTLASHHPQPVPSPFSLAHS